MSYYFTSTGVFYRVCQPHGAVPTIAVRAVTITIIVTIITIGVTLIFVHNTHGSFDVAASMRFAPACYTRVSSDTNDCDIVNTLRASVYFCTSARVPAGGNGDGLVISKNSKFPTSERPCASSSSTSFRCRC